MESRRKSFLLTVLPFGLASAIAGTDLYIKKKMDEELPKDESDIKIQKGILFFRRHHNRGGFLNFGQKYPNEIKGISVFSTILLAIYLFAVATKKGRILEKIGLTFMLGGAASNTYDRVKKGYVMDYASLDVKPKKIRKLVFNLSDISIALGSVFVFISNLTAKDRVL